jgi:thymidylate synthase
MDLVAAVLDATGVVDERTGREVRAVHGRHFHQRGLPLLTMRDINTKWFAAEVVWFLSGGRDVRWMESFGFKNWSKFSDGHGVLDSASGNRWRDRRNPYGFDQLVQLVETLEEDPTAKRTMLDSWVANVDMRPEGHALRKKNAPCVPVVHFTVVDGELHCSAFQRSCDLYLGLPHDIAGISVMHHMLAARLNLPAGDISWTLSNVHLYDNQFELGLQLLDRCLDTAGESPNFSFCCDAKWWDRGLAADKSLVMDVYHRVEEPYSKVKRGKLDKVEITV